MTDGFPGRVSAWSGGYPYDDDWRNDPEEPPPPPPPPNEPPDGAPAEPPEAPPDEPEKRGGDRGGRPTCGVACGRFMPLHTGHEHYLHFARAWVDQLTVLLFTYPGDPISGDVREAWLREAIPSARVVRAEVEAPRRDDPAFWRRWADILRRLLPETPDYFFTGDMRASRIAKHLGTTHVLVDARRDAVPISATRIREDPLASWRFLPACVRPHYVRRVALLGPESTGKSTLARRLAAHFRTVFVPEYARQRAEALGRPFRYEDVEMIARSQLAAEESLARASNRVLFADTDARSLRLWSERMFDRCPAPVVHAATTRRAHLTLVTAPDVPFVGAPALDQPDLRRAFFERALREAVSTSDRVVVLRGTWDERWGAARAAVDAELAERARSADLP